MSDSEEETYSTMFTSLKHPRIGFGIWADTGEFSAYKTMSPG